MPFLSDRLIDGVLVFSLTVLLLSLFLVVYAISRRVRRERDFKQLDTYRGRLQDIFQALRGRRSDYAAAIAEVRAMLRPRLGFPMEQVLLERVNIPGDDEIVRQMTEDLGFVARWQRDLAASEESGASNGRSSVSRPKRGYLTRARSAENLGRVRHSKSWRLLVRALDDPHPDVQGVALRSLAAIGEPESFPALVKRLGAAAGQADLALSERSWRAALGRFPVQMGGALLPLLEDSNPKLRRLAADILMEMMGSSTLLQGRAHDGAKAGCCGQTALPEHADLESAGPEISQFIMARLADDEDPDVRARAASLLSFMRAAAAGRQLAHLLDDEAWFVRLHAARAVAVRKDAGGVDMLAPRLTDASWRVRESAAHALSQFGAEGLDQLVQSFLSTADAYAREQIAEELETSGHLAGFITLCADGSHNREREVLNAIISMGKGNQLRCAPETQVAHA